MSSKPLELNGKIYSVKLADNFIKRAFGLMFRDISEDEGLFFKYGNRKLHIHTFFMKYSIDVIFLKDETIVDVASNLIPWKTYNSKVKSNRMFEVKASGLNTELIGKKVKFN
ncbi:protein of unknown function DUF192 [Methanococcus maripaludis C5]|uniref:DUF192 domain-containing protein n=1 Tax=Methanococcus maripaludis (strain C5 / ATCC BAA-1333) TaxID=402880 RepID=A4G0H5_METM5|nr:DUF192 domain-containing protein [Methanococcus maripaludis]ABO35959.1 protein of unknown function DUF192 [Methanococcus maripaludis C5]